jgi:hypothetical protein
MLRHPKRGEKGCLVVDVVDVDVCFADMVDVR